MPMNPLRWPSLAVVLSLFVGCGEAPTRDISSENPYASFIGKRFRVEVDDLYAYGVRAVPPSDALRFITLIPGVGISGPEIVFKRHVPKGHIFSVVGAQRAFLLFDRGDTYVVEFESNVDLPDVPIQIRLYLERNLGGSAGLNPDTYSEL